MERRRIEVVDNVDNVDTSITDKGRKRAKIR
jgi:hypothetical protein